MLSSTVCPRLMSCKTMQYFAQKQRVYLVSLKTEYLTYLSKYWHSAAFGALSWALHLPSEQWWPSSIPFSSENKAPSPASTYKSCKLKSLAMPKECYPCLHLHHHVHAPPCKTPWPMPAQHKGRCHLSAVLSTECKARMYGVAWLALRSTELVMTA